MSVIQQYLRIVQPHFGVRAIGDHAAAFRRILALGDRAIGDYAAAFRDRTATCAAALGIAVLGIAQPCGRPSQSSSASQTSVTWEVISEMLYERFHVTFVF